MRHRPALLAGCLAAALLLPALANAAKPHQHGVAAVNVVLDGNTLSIALETPLDNLLGFERAPRTDAERRAADAAVARLRAAEQVLRIDPAAQCTLAGVALNSAALKLGQAVPAQAAEGHADLDADYRFTCTGPAPAFVELRFFEAFKGMSRIDVQAVTGKGQSKLTLKRPNQRVPLAR